jgi:hypothetical protein
MAVWKVLTQSKETVQLLRLFRHSSFLWRLRGEADKETEYLKYFESVDLASSLGPDRERVRIELDYFERRKKAVVTESPVSLLKGVTS